MIKGVTDRQASFPEIGAVRKGAPKPADGKRPGADLQYLRVEFDERETQAAATFVKIYGAQPTELNILFPFNEIERNFDAWRETYTAGALIHRCDGERIWYEINPATGERLVVNGEPFKGCDGKAGCKPVGRMKVILPELARLAYLVVHTTSLHDIMNLSRQLEALQAINGGRLAGIPLKLRRRPRKISTPSGENGKRARREKWLLSVEADPEWVAAKVADMKRMSLPEGPATLAIAAPIVDRAPARWNVQAFDAGEDDDESEDDYGETQTGEGNQQAESAHAAGQTVETTLAAPVSKTLIKLRRESANWRAACKAFAARYPRYQQASGEPNMFHILGAAAKCGYSEITDDNWATAMEEMSRRAEEMDLEAA
jgi:hypothetical protein